MYATLKIIQDEDKEINNKIDDEIKNYLKYNLNIYNKAYKMITNYQNYQNNQNYENYQNKSLFDIIKEKVFKNKQENIDYFNFIIKKAIKNEKKIAGKAIDENFITILKINNDNFKNIKKNAKNLIALFHPDNVKKTLSEDEKKQYNDVISEFSAMINSTFKTNK